MTDWDAGQAVVCELLTQEIMQEDKRARGIGGEVFRNYAKGVKWCARMTSRLTLKYLEGDPDKVWQHRANVATETRTIVNWRNPDDQA